LPVGIISNHPKTLQILVSLNPYYVTGFSDAESSFTVTIHKNSELRTGWGVKACFKISLHSKDLALLKLIHLFFGVGSIKCCA
jgi:hypothetical protein